MLDREEAIKAARSIVERKACKPGERQWLVGIAPDSYDDPAYRVEIHALEGSPARGLVVVWNCRDWGIAIALSSALRRIRKFVWGME